MYNLWHIICNALSFNPILFAGVTPPRNYKQSIMDIAIDGLCEMYLGQLPTAKTDWPKHQVTKYLRLALVEKEDVTLMDDHLNKITQLSLRGGVDKILKKNNHLMI